MKSSKRWRVLVLGVAIAFVGVTSALAAAQSLLPTTPQIGCEVDPYG